MIDHRRHLELHRQREAQFLREARRHRVDDVPPRERRQTLGRLGRFLPLADARPPQADGSPATG
jgi:hypothetical protein